MAADLPIVFSTPMVRALLEGRKKQTRRPAWGTPFGVDGWDVAVKLRSEGCKVSGPDDTDHRIAWPPSRWQRVRPGDRLWVRESFRRDGPAITSSWPLAPHDLPFLRFKASEDGAHPPYRPSIHMPRWASRLTLTVTEVRRQRLQDISAEDAIAEGIAWDGTPLVDEATRGMAVALYMLIWASLHGEESVGLNPEVVALSFEVRRNIDAIGRAA